MCSTQLGCSQTFQFFPLTSCMDIDGALLISDPIVEGGFIWKEDGYIEKFN